MANLLTIKVEDQYASKVNDITVASGSVGTTKIKFKTDDSWDSYSGLKASFYCGTDKTNVYYAELDENNECVVPAEALAAAGKVWVGLYGVSGDTIKTSVNVLFEVKDGAIPEAAAEEEENDDVEG